MCHETLITHFDGMIATLDNNMHQIPVRRNDLDDFEEWWRKILRGCFCPAVGRNRLIKKKKTDIKTIPKYLFTFYQVVG